MNKTTNRRLNVSTIRILGLSFAAALITILFVYAACAAERQKNLEAQAETDVFAAMNLNDFDGNPYTTDYFGGAKLTVVNVWETDCPACIGEFPGLESVYQELDPKEVQLIGICGDLIDAQGNVNEPKLAEAREILSDTGVTFLQLIPDSKTYAFFHTVISGYPTTFFVGRSGGIIDSKAGAESAEEWKKTIAEQLAKVS